MAAALLGMLFYAVTDLRCAVVRVPQDQGTIQAGLDALSEGDTVLIFLGEYHESLTAPAIAFSMQGEVLSDTGDFPRPILNPAPLPGSDSLPCMIIPEGSAPTIENLEFRMGACGYPRRGGQAWAGLQVFSHAAVTIRFSLFDSLYGAIVSGTPEQEVDVNVENCRFDNGTFIQIAALRGSIRAADCSFHGTGVQLLSDALVACNYENTFDRCQFTCENCFEVMGCGGFGNRIRNCVFGPCPRTGWSVLSLTNRGDNFVEHNLFVDCDAIAQAVILEQIEGDPLVFARNRFEVNVSGYPCTGAALFVEVGDTTETMHAVIEENDFVGVEFTPCSLGTWGKGIYLNAPVVIQRNRFVNLRPPNRFAILAFDSFGGGTLVRENLFIDNVLGINALAQELDARHNYWGDSTGPYHETLNPTGLGDEVRGNVLFEPWYPDSSFLEASPRTEPSVASYALRAFPNPFNASVTLKFEIPEPGIFRIELFDLLGRRVKELFVGPVAYEKTIRFDGSTLASGIYYARAWQTTHNRPVATAKLVLMK